MADDLYKIDLQRTSGAELYSAVETFTGVNALPLDQRPREGYLLDFKQEWSERALQTVAAFANTFGGLLIVGVSENDARPEVVIGVECPGELKIRLASSIASNITPCPVFEMGECSLPNEPDKKVCAIRVRESAEMCLITKKGERNPAYVRVEDQSLPADAAQLRALVQRREHGRDYASGLREHRREWLNDLFVTKATPIPGQRVRSNTFMRASLFPAEHPRIEVDISIEERFYELANRIFGGLDTPDFEIQLGPRSRDVFKIRRLDHANDFERLWSFNSSGDIGFATQTSWGSREGVTYWSLTDLILDLGHLISTAREFWKSFGYYGGASLQVQMNVHGLDILFGPQGFQARLYDPHGPIARDAIAVCEYDSEAEETQAEADLSYTDDAAYLLARIANQLLRNLGHGADLERLQRSIGAIIPANER
jgi:Schlafen, AlbA_2